MKSGCKAAQSKLRTAERLVNLLATYCILSWRLFWLTMMARVEPESPPGIACTPLEERLLDRLIDDDKRSPDGKSIGSYLIRMARLGGYLARASDPQPGHTVMWRGLSRLTDIELGYILG